MGIQGTEPFRIHPLEGITCEKKRRDIHLMNRSSGGHPMGLRQPMASWADVPAKITELTIILIKVRLIIISPLCWDSTTECSFLARTKPHSKGAARNEIIEHTCRTVNKGSNPHGHIHWVSPNIS